MTERVDGEVREDPGGEAEEDNGAGARKKAPRPSRCGSFTRARLAERLPELVHMLLLEAGAGSLPHLKAVLQLVELDGKSTAAGRRSKGKSLEQLLTERWAELKAEREQADSARQNSQRVAEREAG